jgi:hypothetical protein
MSTMNKFSTPDNLVGNLNGLFKQIYADKLKDLIPDGVKLMNLIKFNSKDKTGDKYNQPVILGMEHGVTFASSDEDGFNLNAAVAGQIKNAEVRGNALVLRSIIGYKAISSSSSSEAAFQEATKYLVANMLRSITKKLEIELLYGQKGYASVASVSTATLTITTAEWAPGIWAGAEGMPIEIRSSDGATSRGEFVVSSVNFANRTVTLTTSAAAAGVGANDVIWHKGAYGKEFIGIHAILEKTSGTLFNIDTATYALFRGNTYSAGSAELSFDKLNVAVARAVEKGLDTKVIVLVNPRTWADLLTEQAALRRYDSSYSSAKLEQGSKGLLFHSQNGDMEIIPSIYVKEGYAYLLEPSSWMRVGSQDVSFKRPGSGEEFFRELENAAGFELRCYCDQALFTSMPSHNVLITGITNNT